MRWHSNGINDESAATARSNAAERTTPRAPTASGASGQQLGEPFGLEQPVDREGVVDLRVHAAEVEGGLRLVPRALAVPHENKLAHIGYPER